MIGSMRLAVVALTAAAAVLAFPAHSAADDTHYQDFLVGEHALGIGGAFTAIADDASAAFYNPAGLALMGRLTISGALSVYGFEHRSVDDAYNTSVGSADFVQTAAVDFVLDRYLGYSPGCTFENDWCDAVERKYSANSGCGVGGSGVISGSGLVLALMTLVGFALLRGRGPRRSLTALVGALVILAGTLAASPARADEGTPALRAGGDPDEGGVPPPVTVPVPEPGPLDPSETTWGAYLGAFGSISKGAVGASFGMRLRVSRHWTFGVDGEWNPWLSFNGPTPIRKGTANIYSTVVLRFPLAYQSFNLATTVNLGVSYLLDDLYGAASGSVGPYLGVSPLGLEWKLSSAFLLILNPLSLAVPVPKMTGVPLWFPQYRFTIGLAVMAG